MNMVRKSFNYMRLASHKNILLASPHPSTLSQVSIPLARFSDKLAEIELEDPASHRIVSWPKPRHLRLIVKPPAPRSRNMYYSYNAPRPELTAIMRNTPESLSHVTSQMINASPRFL